MTAKPEPRIVMRTRTREVRDIFTRQSRRIGEPHVTFRALLARCIDVRSFRSVTAEALLDDSVAHCHALRSGLVVAR
jgi:hypothetical protein